MVGKEELGFESIWGCGMLLRVVYVAWERTEEGEKNLGVEVLCWRVRGGLKDGE